MLRRPPKGVRLQSMNDEPVVEPFAKPAVDRKYLLTMNRCDAWTLLDWSAHPTAKLADLLGFNEGVGVDRGFLLSHEIRVLAGLWL
jgi:hypothetical protein